VALGHRIADESTDTARRLHDRLGEHRRRVGADPQDARHGDGGRRIRTFEG
jgi:hypothetical protein